MTVEKKARIAIRNKKTCFARLATLMLAAAGLITAAGPLLAGVLYVPNRSFESPGAPPDNPYATPDLDEWQKMPQPFWFDPTNFDNTPWPYFMGTFTNVVDTGHIDNVHGNNLGFFFAIPETGFFQDYNSLSGTNVTPSHAFNAKFNVGHSYQLTLGVVGMSPGMSNGVTMQANLYYRDASNNIVNVASTTITNDPSVFSNHTHEVDFSMAVPTVTTNDAWAGKNIGIQLLSTATFTNSGGYWDVDNVRLIETIEVPNFSFELPGAPPDNPYATPELDLWQKTPQPFWYDPTNFDNTPWPYFMGSFTNVVGQGHIDNCHSNNCGFIFALPDVGLFQDFNSIWGTNAAPGHEFNVKYEAGKAYQLTAAVLGNSPGMSNGVTFQISLYYRDLASNMVTVASTSITNNSNNFPNHSHFVDFAARIPIVKSTDPWAGKNIGVQLLSTATFTNMGGYWDVDNVRLVETVATALVNPAKTNGFHFTLLSEPELAFDILASTNIKTASSNWNVIGTVTNVTGAAPITDTNAVTNQRFYQAHKL